MDKATRTYLLSLLLFGSNGIVASYIDLPSTLVVVIRTVLGALALLVAAAARGSKPVSHRDGLYLAASGAALGVGWLFLFEAYRQIGVGVASLAYYCGPVIVMALSVALFGERLGRAKVVGFAAVVLGAFLVVGTPGGGQLSAWGLFCGGMSAVLYAVTVICKKKVAGDRGTAGSAIQIGSAAAVSVAFALVSLLFGGLEVTPSQLVGVNLAAALCLGVVNTGLCCFLYFSSMSDLPVQRVAVLGYLEPLSAVVLSALLLGETMAPASVLGAALILGGALFCELGSDLRARLHGRFALAS